MAAHMGSPAFPGHPCLICKSSPSLESGPLIGMSSTRPHVGKTQETKNVQHVSGEIKYLLWVTGVWFICVGELYAGVIMKQLPEILKLDPFRVLFTCQGMRNSPSRGQGRAKGPCQPNGSPGACILPGKERMSDNSF